MSRKNLPLTSQSLILIALFAVFAGSAFAGSKYRVIHRFQQTGNGAMNPGDLISDTAGNLYGTTGSGGKHGFGTVYELKPPGSNGGAWTMTWLYSFPTGVSVFKSAGAGSLIMDQSGNLYGVTAYGGHGCSIFGCGTVFELTPPKDPGSGWIETNLYVFSGWDGWEPGGLALDEEGNLYGTTLYGGRGCREIGCGTVFKLTPSAHGKAWTRTVLYFFKGVPGDDGSGDGAAPLAVIFDHKGNLYGTTRSGGHCDRGNCYGAAFKLKPPKKKGGRWSENVLYRFIFDNSDQVDSGVIVDKSGALYGNTDYTVYQLALLNGVWTENILASGPYLYSGGVIFDATGNLYSTALWTTQDTNGNVFKLSPPSKSDGTWTQTVLHVFAGGHDGSAPDSGVTLGLGGALYGTTLRGGNDQCNVGGGNVGCGTVFTVAP